ncbi:hypothetical protein [Phenylobacterium sp.]|uniref:hypothetical protein n=1 Tax=Phenylobacterium sp. TaxID=1871053 RepID=UPI001219F9CF|nr:hypothetical protein [Phenylobacterium sp.]THD58781.1 MAG: hypothetical protein E8A49_17455 [Phenylobacterium sp.]
MTVDFSATPEDSPTNSESDTPMFAPIPAWERGKKRRGFGARRAPAPVAAQVAAEPRSFTPADDLSPPSVSAAPLHTGPMMADPVATRPAVDQMGGVDPTDTSFIAGPAFASSGRARRNTSTAPIAIAAGIILVGGLAAAGWYASQPHNTGVAELTPGGATTTTTTTDSSGGDQLAQTTPPPAPVAKAKTTTTTTTHSSGRPAASHRAAASRSASDETADVSANAPTQAQPAPVQAAPPAASAAQPPAAAATPNPPLVLNLPQAPATTATPPAQQAAPTAAAPSDTTPATPPTSAPPQ